MGPFCTISVIVIAGIFVWQFIETRNAVATTSIDCAQDPSQAAALIETAFSGARSVLWTNAAGPGTLNKRRRGYNGGITMSIDVVAASGGGSRVDMWASQTFVYLGFLVNFAGVVNRRKRAIARILNDPTMRAAA